MFQLNEEVLLCGKSSLGLQAVFLAFVIPLIIVCTTIAVGTYLQWEETTSGLTGLLLLVPFYSILYFLRDKLKKRFVFIALLLVVSLFYLIGRLLLLQVALLPMHQP